MEHSIQSANPSITCEEKKMLKVMFFGGTASHELPASSERTSPLTFAPFGNGDPFFSIFPNQLHESIKPQNTTKNIMLAPLKVYSDDHEVAKERTSSELMCPHKNMKHYAKVYYL